MAATRPHLLGKIAGAAGLYMLAVFLVAVLLGTLRVLVLTPLTGPVIAVLVEVPILLALSWLVARHILRRRPALDGTAARLAIGAVAFGYLMLAELALSVLAFGQSPVTFLAAMATPAGALGLTGQIGFALIPWLIPAPDRAG